MGEKSSKQQKNHTHLPRGAHRRCVLRSQKLLVVGHDAPCGLTQRFLLTHSKSVSSLQWCADEAPRGARLTVSSHSLCSKRKTAKVSVWARKIAASAVPANSTNIQMYRGGPGRQAHLCRTTASRSPKVRRLLAPEKSRPTKSCLCRLQSCQVAYTQNG